MDKPNQVKLFRFLGTRVFVVSPKVRPIEISHVRTTYTELILDKQTDGNNFIRFTQILFEHGQKEISHVQFDRDICDYFQMINLISE